MIFIYRYKMYGGEDSDILFLRSIWDFHIQSRIWSKMCKIVAISSIFKTWLGLTAARCTSSHSRGTTVLLLLLFTNFPRWSLKTIESSVILWNSENSLSAGHSTTQRHRCFPIVTAAGRLLRRSYRVHLSARSFHFSLLKTHKPYAPRGAAEGQPSR